MTTPNNPAVDDILRRVSAEVARRQAPIDLGPMQLGLPRVGTGTGVAGIASGTSWTVGSAAAFMPNDRKDYPLSAFVALHGPAFVAGCYAGLLGRSPDSGGLEHYLGLLRQGMAKAEIVGRIRLSAEGRRYGAHVRGLWAPFLFHSSARIPVVGYVVMTAVALVTLPAQKRRLRSIEDAAFTQCEQNARALRGLERRLDAIEGAGADDGGRRPQ
jgi:hypothetical protein